MDAEPTDLDDSTPGRRPRPALWLGVVLVALGALVALVPGIRDAVRVLFGGEPRYEPEHPRNLGNVDLAAVHGELWTRWIVAASRPDRAQRRAAHDALRTAIAADGNLTALFDELASIVDGTKLADARVRDRAVWLTRAWNQYLDGAGETYFLNAQVMLTPDPVFYGFAYRVVADANGTVDGEALRVRVVRRLDTLNIRERYTGYVSSVAEGALVIADRTVQFALDRTWPMFATDASHGTRRAAFAPAIAAEAGAGLSAQTVAVLGATAQVRQEALAVHEAIVARRECGSRFIVPDLPWAGYDEAATERMVRFVEDTACPSITTDEIATLRDTAAVLRGTSGLADALDELVWWRARGIAVHELRHVADDVDLEDEDDLPCAACPTGTSTAVRAEVSAYLAELAWSQAPVLALLDACSIADDPGSLHARAVAVIVQAGRWSCDEGPPADLQLRARDLEDALFGRSEPIVVDDGLQAPVPLVDRAQ